MTSRVIAWHRQHDESNVRYESQTNSTPIIISVLTMTVIINLQEWECGENYVADYYMHKIFNNNE